MSEVNESRSTWPPPYHAGAPPAEGGGSGGDWRYQAVEFMKGVGEMSVEFGKGVRDVVKQNIVRNDSVIVRKMRGPCTRVIGNLRFLNEYLPEDRDPLHAWCVILFVAFLAFAALILDSDGDSTPMVKKMYSHPPSASRILLPDGRHLAYQEQGVSAEQARFSMIVLHSFLSSRLAGLPGIKASLLQEFGIRLVTYDLPGFGESDPHPNRNLQSSAVDLLHLSYAVNVADKFWVVGHSGASMHVWAALRYIPDRIAGAVMIAPLMNPYEPKFTKHESRRIWKKWTMRKKMMYSLARKFPRLLAYYYHRSFLSGNHGHLETLLSSSLGKKDRALVEHRVFEEFWQRDVEESVRQGNVKPFVEEAILQVSLEFSLAGSVLRPSCCDQQTSSIEDEDIEEINLEDMAADVDAADSFFDNSGVEQTCPSTCRI
ncbi:hypothetical protein Leryth_013928 [Lithospermum erythrorhizon]|nr:hypothetical protein Leryth_013928 [Lithospermum erythrorhizon]